jgi:hypothetical protein
MPTIFGLLKAYFSVMADLEIGQRSKKETFISNHDAVSMSFQVLGEVVQLIVPP